MIRNIKIGFLAPYSSIYPGMVPSLISGFYSALPDKYHPLFQIVPEYVGQGGEKSVAEAAKKLLHFNQVDLLSGIVSYRVLPSIIPTVESRQKLGFFFDVGEYIPYTHHVSDSVFYNSFQLWQSEFALGDWAHRQFGEKGAVILPIYDGGYHLQSAFRQGAVMAGADVLDLHLLRYQPDTSQVEGQLGPLLEQIKKEQPSFIHAIFCGTEAQEFFAEYCKSGLNQKIPLIVSGHMASEEILKPINNLNFECYSASLWNYHSSEKANQEFCRRVTEFAGQQPDLFTLLGYETGLLFYQLLPEFQKRDFTSIKKRLQTETIIGPRGECAFALRGEKANPVIDIEKINFRNGQVNKLVVEKGKAMPYHHETYEKIHMENISGWQNPYLCV